MRDLSHSATLRRASDNVVEALADNYDASHARDDDGEDDLVALEVHSCNITLSRIL